MLAAASIEATSLFEGKERKMEPAEGEISNPICMRGGGGGGVVGIRVTSELAADMNVRRLIRTPPV